MMPTLSPDPVAGNGDATLTDAVPLPTQAVAETDPPACVGRFLIRARIGEGAFGVVYKAYDPQLDREVALKIAKPCGKDNHLRVERFLREGAAAGRLRHPHIVPVFDAGRDGDRYYIASAFIEGRTLEEAVAMNDLDYRRSAQIVLCLAEALRYAHGQGVVHRDVKPANVLLDEHGQPLLTDFGLAARPVLDAKLTQVGAILGTPLYTAPEQATGRNPEPSPAADQYSLGVLLFELLTGRPPFVGTPDLLRFLHQDQPPPSPRQFKPDLPRDLEAICLRCLNKNPAARYADCRQLADDLRRFLDGETIVPPRPGMATRVLGWRLRRPRRVVAVALGLMLVGALLVAGYCFTQRTAEDGPLVGPGQIAPEVQTIFAVNAGGPASNALGASVAIDAAGNSYVVGVLDGKVWFDSAKSRIMPAKSVASAGGHAAFVAKYSAEGKLLWVQPFGGGVGHDEASAVAVDPKGFIYVAGHFEKTVVIDTKEGIRNLTCARRGIFVLKMDLEGGVEWARQMAGDHFDFPVGMALDKESNVHVCGEFTGVVNFDPVGGSENIGFTNRDSAFVVKLDQYGKVKWARAFGGDGGTARANGIAIGHDGSVYSTGHFTGKVQFDPMNGAKVIAAANQEVFVSKLDGEGKYVWAKNAPSTSGGGLDIKIDANDTLYVSGVFQGTLQFGDGRGAVVLTGVGDYNQFVAKFESDGQPLWARRFGGPGLADLCTLAVDPASAVYAVGRFKGTAGFDPEVSNTTLTSAGSMDVSLFKLNADGHLAWARRFGGDLDDGGAQVAVDANGGVFFCGTFNGTATFDAAGDSFMRTSRGARSMFLARLKDNHRP